MPPDLSVSTSFPRRQREATAKSQTAGVDWLEFQYLRSGFFCEAETIFPFIRTEIARNFSNSHFSSFQPGKSR
jgi:hypothetical protein